MKKYVYRVEGSLAEDRRSALCEALCAIPTVGNATVLQDGENTVTLTLVYKADLKPDELNAVESLVSSCVSKEGVTLELPSLANTYVTAPLPKQGKTVSLMAAVGTVITAVILAVLCTFAAMTVYHQRKSDMTVIEGNGTAEENPYDILELFDRIFAQSSPLEMDREEMIHAVLDAYVEATGDLYAEYYTKEEYSDLTADQNGEMCGIGIQVVNGLLNVNDIDYQAIIIANVYAGSPAEAAGLLPGDAIMYVGSGDEAVMVHGIGYTEALESLAGEEGTLCEFMIYRATEDDSNNLSYEEIPFSIERKKLTVHSVNYYVCDTDASVGIIRMMEFDHTTPTQFSEAVEALKAQGCTSFVFDLRGNPGGLLTSVVDVLTYFLNEGDVILTAKDKYDRVETVSVGTVNGEGYLTSGSGSLTAADVGKYRDLQFAVLVNEYSASAAELFTANIIDYKLGQVVGVTTYGKGSMQSTFPLAYYGYEGALKLTTKYYFPPNGEGYDGIGITPHKVVELSEEAQEYNINLLPHNKDNQLQEAIRLLKP